MRRNALEPLSINQNASRYLSVSIAILIDKGIIPDTPILYYFSGVVIPIKCFRRIFGLTRNNSKCFNY